MSGHMFRMLCAVSVLALAVFSVEVVHAQREGAQLVFHEVPEEQEAQIREEWDNVGQWFSEAHGLEEPQFTMHIGLSYESVRHLLDDRHDAEACQWNTPDSSVVLLPCEARQTLPELYIAWIGIGGRSHVIEDGHRLFGPWWLDLSLHDHLHSTYAAWLGGSLERERYRRQLAVRDDGRSLRELETADAWYRDHETSRHLGWLAVDWLVQRAGDTSYVEYMTSRGKYRHWSTAFEAVFGLTPESFYEQFAVARPQMKRVVTGATEEEADATQREGLWLTTILYPGLNAIGWVEALTPTASVFAAIPDAVAMFAWDAADQKWRFARRGDTVTGRLDVLRPGMGILLRVVGDSPIQWLRRVAPVQPAYLSGSVELQAGWNLVAWAGWPGSLDVLRGDFKELWRWDESSQEWRIGKSYATGGQFTSEAAHGEAIWINMEQRGLWRQSPAGWWPAEEAKRDWIASIRFWGDVDRAERQRVLADRAADVSEYFAEWFGASTAPHVHAGADDDETAKMYAELKGHNAVARCDNADINEILMNLACFETEQRVAFSFVHEYFHTLQRAEYNERYYTLEAQKDSGPRWLLEGGAKYAENRYLDDRGLGSYDAQRSMMVRHMLGMDMTLRESTIYGSAAPFFLGMLAWERLVEKAGDFSLLGYYRNRALRADPEEAFQATFGISLEEFYEEFEAWRAAGFARE